MWQQCESGSGDIKNQEHRKHKCLILLVRCGGIAACVSSAKLCYQSMGQFIPPLCRALINYFLCGPSLLSALPLLHHYCTVDMEFDLNPIQTGQDSELRFHMLQACEHLRSFSSWLSQGKQILNFL